jgi:outer membrane receptor protein involved in Fe transport
MLHVNGPLGGHGGCGVVPRLTEAVPMLPFAWTYAQSAWSARGGWGSTPPRGIALPGVRAIVFGLAAVLLVFVPGPSHAATPAGTIEGIAKDALQRPLPAAQLRIETPDGQVVGRTTADDQGHFAFTGVAPGTYAVIGEKEGFEAATAIVTLPADAGAGADLTLASKQALDMTVVAKRLEGARINIQPQIGASTYSITSRAIESQPGGANAPLSQVLLRAPGVAQDAASEGGLHIRNEHANVQYRINGVPLPEGVSMFGQALSPRFASSIDLLTGALPAQYGLRTAGIVDIQTKSGSFGQGGSAGMYGGVHAWLQPSAEVRGSAGRFNYFATGDYLQNSLGINAPTPSYNATHDDTRQGNGFGYVEYVLDSTSKVSAVVGSFLGHFELPNRPGQVPMFKVNTLTTFDSTLLDERQREASQFGVLSYRKSGEDFTFQLIGFTRYTSLRFSPDPNGDLIFNGIAQAAKQNNFANGLLAEGSYTLGPAHTLRAGVSLTGERGNFETTSSVLPAMGGVQTGVMPFTLIDNLGKTAWTYSVYLQDEWRVTPTVTVNFGGRFDVVNAFTDENQISPRANVVWVPAPGTTLHAGYARYFTPPPFQQASTASVNIFTNTTAEPPVKLNSPAKAERNDYFDVGASQEILPGLKVGVDGYYKWSQNLLDVGRFGAPIVLTPFNYNHGRNIGIELTGSYTLGAFSAYGNLAIAEQKGKEIVSAQFNFTPEDLAWIAGHYINTDHSQLLTASVGASYLWHDTRLSVDFLAGTGLRKSVDHPNDQMMPYHTQVNLGLARRFTLPTLGAFEARLDVTNLLDSIYQIRDGTGLGVFGPQFGPRRAIFGGLKKEF